jgi:hypothetical protein
MCYGASVEAAKWLPMVTVGLDKIPLSGIQLLLVNWAFAVTGDHHSFVLLGAGQNNVTQGRDLMRA